MGASREELVEAEEVGEKIADAILEYFADERNRALIERLRQAGIRTEAEEQRLASEQLKGLQIVISGSFERHSRDELKALIEAHGGKNLAAVSGNADYLLAGAKMGPAKLKKAEQLGVKIISEAEFEAMIGGEIQNPQSAIQHLESELDKPADSEDRKTSEENEIPVQGRLF